MVSATNSNSGINFVSYVRKNPYEIVHSVVYGALVGLVLGGAICAVGVSHGWPLLIVAKILPASAGACILPAVLVEFNHHKKLQEKKLKELAQQEV